MSIHNRPTGLPNQFWGALLVFITVLVLFGASVWFSQVEVLSFLPTPTPTPIIIGGVVVSPTPNLDSADVGQSSIVISSPTPIPTLPSPTPSDSSAPAFEIPTITPLPRPTLSIEEISEGRERPTCGEPPPGWVSYIVQSGDTVFGLSLRTKATISQIVEVNCIENSIILRGTRIYLPTSPPPAISACASPPGNWLPYVVQRGNTMYSLAVQTGTTTFDVQRYNCLPSSRLITGTIIRLPGGGPAAAPTAPPSTVPPPPQPTSPPAPTSPPPPTATATQVAPTPTMTPLPTATATIVILPTATPTNPVNPSPTVGPTATATSPATVTPTIPPTVTFTPTPIVPTATPTIPPTATATAIPTATVAPTATATIAPTATATPNNTPTFTPTP